MEPRLMNFPGTHQTCYADWSRCVLSYYPFGPKYQLNGDIVAVFYENKKIAEYDFSTGKAFLVHSEVHSLEKIGKIPNFEEFDIDNLLYKE